MNHREVREYESDKQEVGGARFGRGAPVRGGRICQRAARGRLLRSVGPIPSHRGLQSTAALLWLALEWLALVCLALVVLAASSPSLRLGRLLASIGIRANR